MPVSFSTLEDAWGSPFATNDKSKMEIIKRKQNGIKKNKDPLCELYGKRYSKVSKSYSDMENDDFSNNFALYDKNKNSRNMKDSNSTGNTRQEYYPIELDEYSSFASVKAIETMDDDEYLDNALDKISNENQSELLVTSKDEDYSCDDEDTPVDKVEKVTNKINITSDDDEINYLDFGLYVTSGIMLIFMMEQFIQLGLKMKSL